MKILLGTTFLPFGMTKQKMAETEAETGAKRSTKPLHSQFNCGLIKHFYIGRGVFSSRSSHSGIVTQF